MTNTKSIIIGVIILVIIGFGVYVWPASSIDDSMQGDAMMDKTGDSMIGEIEDMADEIDNMMMGKGSYEAYGSEKLAFAENGKVVLFFRASWCPTCRTLDADIRSNLGDIPEGVMILDVNYDDSTALKQKYGVTYQHTLVQVDSAGNQIAKWTSSPTLIDLISKIK